MPRPISKKQLTDFWYEEFRGPREHRVGHLGFDNFMSHCGICGNTGIIDTRGKVFTPAGFECGIRAWCICPNGRAWKRTSKQEYPPER